MERKKMERKRIRGFGTVPGVMRTGPKNKITDMPGVLAGHETVRSGDNKTGITIIVPGPRNVFDRKFIAAGYVHNGFGKTCGLVQVKELGTLETPIALTNTLNVDLAADALVEYAIEQCAKEQVGVTSVSPVVGECNDCRIDRIQHRTVSMEDVMEAFSRANEDFKESDVGTGTGTVCYGLKGRIGSTSRIMRIGGKKYTLGVLVRSNFGATEDLVISDIRAGEQILEERERRRKMAAMKQDQGSIMTIVATNLPVSDRQLKHITHRTGVGVVRTGACTNHGGGEVMIGSITTGRLQGKDSPEIVTSTCIRKNLINVTFRATTEAVHETILNSVATARRTGGLTGEAYYSLSEFLPQILKH